MSAPAVERLTSAGALTLAANLINRRGLCRDDYEDETGAVCPAGAVALVLGAEDAGEWSKPGEWFLESGAYDVGFAALYALVASIGRWDMGRPAEEPWDGESLANHVAFWLADVRPSVEQVVHQMRAAALSLPEQTEVNA
ncbi:hypothetical protein AB0F88_39710 [Streptosporangium sp. NPDC023963]|uniref:DUF6197 family protein n=1 Tax=Streptosporangium sp. NPDC023963 TaxID=3155608 RepID=UPI00343E9636